MKVFLSLPVWVLMTACAADRATVPDKATVDQIERRLSTDPCVGSLNRWFREYAYGLDHQRGGADTNIVWFSLHEAGRYEFTAGRSIMEPEEFMTDIDDRPYRVAFGTYTISNSALEIMSCGPN